MKHRRRLLWILVASAVLCCIAALGALYITTDRYKKAVKESQTERVGYIINQYVNEIVWKRFAGTVGDLARDIAQEERIRAAVRATDRDRLNQLLPEASRRNAVTSGEVPILGVTVYATDGAKVAEYATVQALESAAALSRLLGERKGNERFARMRYVWVDSGKPRLSLVVPVGGLNLAGYLAVHVDPFHALRSLDDDLGMQIAFTSVDGAAILSKLQNFKMPESATAGRGNVVVKAPSGLPVFRANVGWDDSETENLVRSIREWSFTITVAVLAVIMGGTLVLVLVVSRRMAREESDAAKAALTARMGEEEQQRHEQEAKEAERLANAARHAILEQLASELDHSVRTVADNVSEAARGIEQSAATLSDLAARTSQQAETARTASAQASENVQTVSSGTQQITGSIAQIGSRMAEASRITGEAVEGVKRVDVKLKALGAATGKIGEVVALINSIAAQTNLLALNATIEAARAGEMGKGFAIVAQEVKTLAGQTARATDEIARQINSVQVATTDVVDVIQTISSTIELINQIASAIENEVEEQHGEAAEIAKAIRQAADGASMISASVINVTQQANQTEAKAGELKAASNGLSRESITLREKVANFAREIRAA